MGTVASRRRWWDRRHLPWRLAEVAVRILTQAPGVAPVAGSTGDQLATPAPGRARSLGAWAPLSRSRKWPAGAWRED